MNQSVIFRYDFRDAEGELVENFHLSVGEVLRWVEGHIDNEYCHTYCREFFQSIKYRRVFPEQYRGDGGWNENAEGQFLICDFESLIGDERGAIEEYSSLVLEKLLYWEAKRRPISQFEGVPVYVTARSEYWKINPDSSTEFFVV